MFWEINLGIRGLGIRMVISNEGSIKDDSSFSFLSRKVSNFLTSSKNSKPIILNIKNNIKSVCVCVKLFLLNSEKLDVFALKEKTRIPQFSLQPKTTMYGH